MTKVMVLSDSFKSSASSLEVGNWIKSSLNETDEAFSIDVYPFADGGEGTLEALLSAISGEEKKIVVKDIFLNDKIAKYGVSNETILIESAEVIGIESIKKEALNPFEASSYGLGVLFKEVLHTYHPKTIYLGIGGTATNDGGLGFLQALGGRFLDKKNQEVSVGIKGLKQVSTIDLSGLEPLLKETKKVVLSDVENTICGEKGATYVFGPQKGLPRESLLEVDQYMLKFCQLLSQEVGRELATIPGTGAAGGLGLALQVLPNISFQSGIETILQLNKIEEKLSTYDLVITGEGRVDNQSQLGKVPIGIARLTKKVGIPLMAIVGSQSYEQENSYQEGIDLIVDIIHEPLSLKEAIEDVESLVKKATKTVYHAYKMIEKYQFR